MSDTVLEHLLVREYLRELSAACVTLPVAQARELREQITAHLDEALPPGATDAEVRAELARLGSPRSLAAEAAGPGWQPVARRLRNWLGHVRWWVWAALAVLVAALGTWAGFLDSMNSAAPLHVSGTGWLYPVDQQRAIDTTAAGAARPQSPFGRDNARGSSSPYGTTATGRKRSSAPTPSGTTTNSPMSRSTSRADRTLTRWASRTTALASCRLASFRRTPTASCA